LGSSLSGASQRPAIEPRAKGKGQRAKAKGNAMFDYIVSGIVSILLLVYLSWAMFQPEKF
jgi:K+-transporting ATPase KdpF subunit